MSFLSDENVFGLEFAVDDALLVEVSESDDDLCDDVCDNLL